MGRKIVLQFRELILALALSVFVWTAEVCAATPPTHANLAYAPHWRQRIDLYIPQDRPGPFPVVVYLHGGGWLAGDKSSAAPYVDDLLARGLAVAAVNYRFSYQVTYPAQLHDCKGAIRWLRAKATLYNLDPQRIAAFGESSGGHLASLLGTTGSVASLEGSVGGNTGYSSAVSAVVDGYGPTDLFELAQFSVQRGYEISALIGYDIYDIIANRQQPSYAALVALVNSANPAFHAASDDPASYIVHGELDTLVPYSQSELLSNALSNVGAPETFRLLAGVGHEIPDAELPVIYDFLRDHLTPLPVEFITGGKASGEGFGHAIAVMGDVNGDGIDDFAVGAPFNSDGGKNIGRVAIVSGADGTVLRVLKGRAAGDRFGFALAACGDVNGDGVRDIVIASPHARTAGGAKAGRVEIYSGKNWKRLRELNGSAEGDQFGHAVACADVNGDGVADLIIGAPFADVPALNAGSVFIHNGASGVLMRRFNGSAKNDRFGWSVANAGDVDGDGRDDAIIGAPLTDKQGANGGSLVVVGMSGNKWITRFTRNGVMGERLGWAVAGVGDVDGDGRADVAGGVPSGAVNGVVCGVVRVFSPANKNLIATLAPPHRQAGANFGSAITAIGDVNGDGRPEIAVGAPGHDLTGEDRGRVSVHSTIAGVLAVYDGEDAGAGFGSALAAHGLAGGLAGSGLVIGSPQALWNAQRRGTVHTLNAGLSP